MKVISFWCQSSKSSEKFYDFKDCNDELRDLAGKQQEGEVLREVSNTKKKEKEPKEDKWALGLLFYVDLECQEGLQGFKMDKISLLQGHLAILEDIFCCHKEWKRVDGAWCTYLKD